MRAARQARLVVVPHSTHLVSVVAPVAFTRVLLGALDELDARSAPAGRRMPQARTPPTIPAEFGTTTTSSPRASSTTGRMRRELPPPM